MDPFVALCVWLILLLALLCLDPAKDSGISFALWIPVIWMVIVASRLPSIWLNYTAGYTEAQALEDGNLLDRTISIVLILLAVGILTSRSFQWAGFLRRNIALIALIFFGLLSVLWSEFPLVAFKRWFRDLAMYFMIPVVLCDPHPLEAVRTLLRRVSYMLLPLSLLLIKYYPAIGTNYTVWGAREVTGVATSKNGLGVLCLVSGLFFFWDTLTRWSARKEWRTRKIIAVNLAFLAMTLRLLYLAHSATSNSCFVIGCAVILIVQGGIGKRHPVFLRAVLPVSFLVYAILAYSFNLNSQLAPMVGRNSDLTNRTLMWSVLLHMNTNPLFGVGYQSFFLGYQLQLFWQRFGGKVTEAHNGYLGVYLNLGLIGLVLLIAFLVGSYRTILKRLKPFSSFASLSLAIWTVVLFYNVTEEAMKLHLIWVTFLLVAINVPVRSEKRIPDLPTLDSVGAVPKFARLPQETGVAQMRKSLMVGKQNHVLRRD